MTRRYTMREKYDFARRWGYGPIQAFFHSVPLFLYLISIAIIVTSMLGLFG